ncbi:hypothetical protein, partial [Mariniflexile rhizosphaerae]|uniref:hypothetical protein n=1 Tax=unclassified Mariniflexile TaxID=2643887 RepID=UPI00390CA7C5
MWIKKKHRKFAAAKKGSSQRSEVHKRLGVSRFRVRKKNLKKNTETIVGLKKGFYICTRLARKRAG